MTRLCIAVVDAARARLFTFEDAGVEPGHSPLVERMDLVDPERRLPLGEVLSDKRPSLGYTPTGRHYSVDDKRQELHAGLERKFAARIVTELAKLVREEDFGRVVLVAGPRMLGLLRRDTAELVPPGAAIEEVPLDLPRCSPSELQDRLAERGVLPHRTRAASHV